MKNIKHLKDLKEMKLITKGLSQDTKYRIEACDGWHLLLRLADVSEFDQKKEEYERMQIMDQAGVPMPQPVDFGLCNEGKQVYQLLTWCDGENLETILPLLPETEQYVTGLKVGEALRKIHSAPAIKQTVDWKERYTHVIDERIQAFYDCGVQFDGWENIINYYKENCHLLKDRPQVCLHGDLHAENILRTNNGNISVIDWQILDFQGYGDPWRDFSSDQCATSPHYATGCIKGYFGGEAPAEFWKLNALYISVGAITSIPWAYYNYPSELEPLIQYNLNVIRWFDNMNNPVPNWYQKDFYIQYMDKLPLKLKAPFDFTFLSQFGKVFKVYDDQDSGNICFGIQNGDKKLFVKFAGAPTEQSCISTEEAIANLRSTLPIYKNLTHPNLIKFMDAQEIGSGFAMIFEWVDAESMHPMYPQSRKKFMSMSLETKHQVFHDILSFLAYVAKEEYIAIDFYDGSIMYDFNNNRTVICDIDFFVKAPYINNMGQMWGSSRFMSPEEYKLGAPIDEVTNVYTIGAMAFTLFGNATDRCIEKWKLSKELFEVAKKAVSDNRSQRQQSIKQFIKEWNDDFIA